jgi:hypothetical protein
MPTTAQYRELDGLVNKSGGYDFYWSLKQGISRISTGKETYAEACGTIDSLAKVNERKYNSDALNSVHERFLVKPGINFIDRPAAEFSLLGSRLGIRIQPELAFAEKNVSKAVHVWAMQSGALSTDLAGVGLSLMKRSLPQGFECYIFDTQALKLRSEKIISNKPDVVLLSDYEKLSRMLDEILGAGSAAA